MSRRLRLTTVLAVSLLLGSACTSTDEAADSPGSSPPAKAPSESSASAAPVQLPTTGTLRMFPPLSQPGASPAPASEAESLITSSFDGRAIDQVLLQRRAQSGWSSEQRASVGRDGTAQFTAPFSLHGEVQTYRVAVLEDGEVVAATKPTRADAWGAPELDDEFGGESLPPQWTRRDQQRTGFRLCSTSSPEAIHVGEGVLRLSVLAAPEPPPGEGSQCRTQDGAFDWRLIGHVSTEGRRAFQYGIAAARIKFQPRAGQHGAFWMQPAAGAAPVGDPSTTGAEIDVIEWFGQRSNPDTQLASTAYWHPTSVQDADVDRERAKACGSITDPARYGEDWARHFHVFSVEWTPERYVFRIDGRETCRTTEGVSGVEQFLILSLQANSYELPLLDGARKPPHGSTALPQHMYVDWVRFWQR